jgi:hypothetical protein
MKLLRWFAGLFRREKPKLSFAGIYGVTSDGCYIVLGEDGVMRKTPPIQPPKDVVVVIAGASIERGDFVRVDDDGLGIPVSGQTAQSPTLHLMNAQEKWATQNRLTSQEKRHDYRN